jgi:hypothetical protein
MVGTPIGATRFSAPTQSTRFPSRSSPKPESVRRPTWELIPARAIPHLRSVVEVNGYHVHATDGDIGQVENFLASDVYWDIRYLVIATHNWWPGKHVRLAPYAVKDIDWAERRINVNITRDQVKSSPPWDPLELADQVAEEQLHRHYGWPGYGW